MNGGRSVAIDAAQRVDNQGKFLFVGDEKLYVRGVSYGTFAPSEHGDYPPPHVVARDFAQMAANAINTVRIYSAPPRWLLDEALAAGLRVIVGLAWEQHVAFLDDRGRARRIEARVRADVRALAGHPAILCYSIGNEIPAPIVRWHGRRRIERFLKRLQRAAKEEDPGALVTYVNYPSTEYLDLSFLDVVCFNVFLEQPERLDAYLARLQNLAGDRPLILTELGLDSRSHGEETQAASLSWQLHTAFGSGCAGAVVFSWTDEWHRGGVPIEDWDFGLTDRARCPKPALAAVRRAFSEAPFPSDDAWPRASIVVCTYNGARTLRSCLAAATQVDYPEYEVIVVDDGSTDSSSAIAEEAGAHVIRTANRGLSAARNTGLRAATGDVVAYVDDDTEVDAHWLKYLVGTLRSGDYAAVGGPNPAPPGDGTVAAAVARSPGGPVHVLLSDREAEHVPGCNMAFWKDRLEAIGGFDPQFRVAGDDVDVCWRIHERGWRIAFSPAATVWHHRRNSVRTYFRQQRGYGRAEALLERKWPERYNRGGHVTWAGRVYGPGGIPGRSRIYFGTWGNAPFQSVYEGSPRLASALPVMPEWYLVTAVLGLAAAWSSVDETLCFMVPGLGVSFCIVLFALALAALVGRVATRAWAETMRPPTPHQPRATLFSLVALLHFAQPLARLVGRVGDGLTPWRLRPGAALASPFPRTVSVWSEVWQQPEALLERVERRVRDSAAVVRRGGAFDDWDLHVRAGTLGRARTRMAVEEHGSGKQLFRFRVSAAPSRGVVTLAAVVAALSALAFHRGGVATAIALAVVVCVVLARVLVDTLTAVAILRRSIAGESRQQTESPRSTVRTDVLAWDGPRHASEQASQPIAEVGSLNSVR